MFTKYCEENNADWDEGIHFVLYAIRSSVQDSLGFTPFELVYGHDVRGPLKVLKESWLDVPTNKPLLTYVHQFKQRLKSAVKHAMSNLKAAQLKMKENFDLKAVPREFKPGDHVLAFLPIPPKPCKVNFMVPTL